MDIGENKKKGTEESESLKEEAIVPEKEEKPQVVLNPKKAGIGPSSYNINMDLLETKNYAYTKIFLKKKVVTEKVVIAKEYNNKIYYLTRDNKACGRLHIHDILNKKDVVVQGTILNMQLGTGNDIMDCTDDWVVYKNGKKGEALYVFNLKADQVIEVTTWGNSSQGVIVNGSLFILLGAVYEVNLNNVQQAKLIMYSDVGCEWIMKDNEDHLICLCSLQEKTGTIKYKAELDRNHTLEAKDYAYMKVFLKKKVVTEKVVIAKEYNNKIYYLTRDDAARGRLHIYNILNKKDVVVKGSILNMQWATDSDILDCTDDWVVYKNGKKGEALYAFNLKADQVIKADTWRNASQAVIVNGSLFILLSAVYEVDLSSVQQGTVIMKADAGCEWLMKDNKGHLICLCR